MLSKLAEQARQTQDGAAMVVKDTDEMIGATAASDTALSPALSSSSTSAKLLSPMSIVIPPLTPSRMSSASSSAPSPTPTLESLASPARLDAILRVTEFPPDEHDHHQQHQQQQRQTLTSPVRPDTDSASPIMKVVAAVSPPALFSGSSTSPQLVSSELDAIVRDAGGKAPAPLAISSSLIQRPKPGKSKLNAFAVDWVQQTRGDAADSGLVWRAPVTPRKSNTGPSTKSRPAVFTGLTTRACAPTATNVVPSVAATCTLFASPHTYATVVNQSHVNGENVEPQPRSALVCTQVASSDREEKYTRHSKADDDDDDDDEPEQVTSITHGTAYHVYSIYPPFIVQRFLEFVRQWVITGNTDVITKSTRLNSMRKTTTQPLSSSSLSPTPLEQLDDGWSGADDDSVFQRGGTPTLRASTLDTEHADGAVRSVTASYDILEVYSDFKYAVELGRSAMFPEIVPRTHGQVQVEPMRYVLKVVVTPSMAHALKRLGFVNSMHPYKKQVMNSVVPYILEIAPLVCICSPSLSFHPIAPWSPTYPVASSFVVRLQPEIANLKTAHLMTFFKHLLKTLAKYELMPPNGWTIERTEKYHDAKPASSNNSTTSTTTTTTTSPASSASASLASQTPQQSTIHHEIRIHFSRYPMALLSVACTLLKDMSYNFAPALETLANSTDGSPLSASDREQLDALRRTCRIACQFATLLPHSATPTTPLVRTATSHVSAAIPSSVTSDSERTSPSPSPDSSSALTTPPRARGSMRFSAPRRRGNGASQRGSGRGTRSRGRGVDKTATEPSLPSSSP